MKLPPDPIVEEVRRIRRKYSEEHNHDLDAMYVDLKRYERECGLTFVRRPPRHRRAGPIDEKGIKRGV